MKILFICDWDFSYLWEEVSSYLKSNEQISSSCALVVGKLYYEWLMGKENSFDDIYLLQENIENPSSRYFDLEALSSLEKKYDEPSLWRFLWADRSWIHSSYEDAVKLLVCVFDFYEKLLEEMKPDVIFTNGYASMPHLVNYAVANKMEIPIITPVSTRVGFYQLPSNNPYQMINRLKRDSEMRERSANERELKEAKEYIKNFRSNPKKPAYDSMVTRKRKKRRSQGVIRFLRYSYRYFISGVYRNDHTKDNPFVRLFREIKHELSGEVIKRSFSWDRWSKGDTFVYFPLHVQPEETTMTLAPFYLNQISLIENIAKSIPNGLQVFVKEHPKMLGRRRRGYYRELQKIANVKVLAPSTDTFKLMRGARAVFTITGTAGLEGMLLGKPVITFGATFYNECSLVRKLGDFPPTRWGEEIKKYLSSFERSEEEIENFLAHIISSSYEIHFTEPNKDFDGVMAPKNINAIANFVMTEAKKATQSEINIKV